jgi:hypothetical protein
LLCTFFRVFTFTTSSISISMTHPHNKHKHFINISSFHNFKCYKLFFLILLHSFAHIVSILTHHCFFS